MPLFRKEIRETLKKIRDSVDKIGDLENKDKEQIAELIDKLIKLFS